MNSLGTIGNAPTRGRVGDGRVLDLPDGADLVALAKPRITAMVVATFAGGYYLAADRPAEIWRAVFALVGTVLVVAAANALNMYLERDVDGLMARTRNRPLPSNRLGPEVALGLGLGCVSASTPFLYLGGGGLTCLLGLIAFALYVFAYTPLKRVTWLALFVGAVPGALPPLMGWVAATGRITGAGLALFAVLFAWQIPHFLAIAGFREADYGRAGLKVLSGERRPALVRGWAVAGVLVTLFASLALGLTAGSGLLYAVAATGLGAWFLGRAVRQPREVALAVWAKRLFIVSLFYLTGLFVALLVDLVVARTLLS